jgi:ABC-2 type transport system ATP-binding protein
MELRLNKLGKRYKREWIFKQIDRHFDGGTTCAILGANGAGKSTFLKVLSGHLSPTQGNISYIYKGQTLDISEVYRHLAIAAPYIELIEEFTLAEAIRFHRNFKKMYNLPGKDGLLEVLALPRSATNKEIRHFSSGMKQRLKLALAICSDVPLLLLDEPTTNLDAQGVAWFHSLLGGFSEGRTIFVASNVADDVAFCTEQLTILDYK